MPNRPASASACGSGVCASDMSRVLRPEMTSSAALLSSALWMPWKKPATFVPPRHRAAV
jgi:hypothetical protein